MNQMLFYRINLARAERMTITYRPTADIVYQRQKKV